HVSLEGVEEDTVVLIELHHVLARRDLAPEDLQPHAWNQRFVATWMNGSSPVAPVALKADATSLEGQAPSPLAPKTSLAPPGFDVRPLFGPRAHHPARPPAAPGAAPADPRRR